MLKRSSHQGLRGGNQITQTKKRTKINETSEVTQDDANEYVNRFLFRYIYGRLEQRARMWKVATKQYTIPDETAESGSAPASSSIPDSTDPRILRIARLSLYYDPVNNPLGAPPPHKPPAYRHPGGIIRAYPPAQEESSDSESASAESSESEDEVARPVSEVAKMPAIAKTEHIKAAVRPPPPRPLGTTGQRPLLPMKAPQPLQSTKPEPVLEMHESFKPKAHPLSSAALPVHSVVHAKQPTRTEVTLDSNEIILESTPAAPPPASTATRFIPSSVKKRD